MTMPDALPLLPSAAARAWALTRVRRAACWVAGAVCGLVPAAAVAVPGDWGTR